MGLESKEVQLLSKERVSETPMLLHYLLSGPWEGKLHRSTEKCCSEPKIISYFLSNQEVLPGQYDHIHKVTDLDWAVNEEQKLLLSKYKETAKCRQNNFTLQRSKCCTAVYAGD